MRFINSQPSKRILFLCREEKDLLIISKIKSNSNIFFVATDDYIIHNKILSYKNVSGAIPLDNMNSMFSVNDEIANVKNQISIWFQSFKVEIPTYLFEISEQIEGPGLLTNVKDIVLNINSLSNIIIEYKIEEIIFTKSKKYNSENILVKTIASKYNIHTKEISRNIFSSIFIKLFRAMGPKIGLWKFELYLPLNFYIILKTCFLVLKTLILKTNSFNPTNYQDKNIITFLLGSNSNKHVIPSMNVMKEINISNLLVTNCLLWGTTKGLIKFKNNNLDAIVLESLLSIHDIFISLLANIKIINKFSQTIKQNSFCINFKGYDITALLRDSILIFISLTLFERCLIHEALKKYFSIYKPVAVKLYGGTNLDLGLITYFILNSSSLINRIPTHGPKPLLFSFPIGFDLGCYLDHNPHMYDLNFVASNADKLNHDLGGYSAKEIKVVGPVYKNHIISKKETNRIINRSGNLRILYASSNIVKGMISSYENSIIIGSLFKFAKINTGSTLNIKLHPAEDPLLVYRLYSFFNNPINVTIIHEQLNIGTLINSSDIVITKFSTIAIEAAFEQTAVILIMLDDESRFKIRFSNGFNIITNETEIETSLTKLSEDNEYFHKWYNQTLEKQNTFLENEYSYSDNNACKMIAHEIIKRCTPKIANVL